MPTLFRFLTVIAIAIGLVYGAMFALATFVTPRKVQMVVPIPLERVDPNTVSTPSQ
ncbi:histidine kinase [Tianweitania sediminis]|jgi:hypothetical protein|uniref:Histidine kinase n=1 Tax=Tianweitania sediminis TaxID=1502156 RepID=A0A8J7UK02_9HYPH|nr:histidine kinase [Tianweitania sediminis]MBP0437872.1 histidine kinase [Tianweitania sediminis]HEV7417609.1 histidine kinase [Tianweitania sediminis]